MAFAVIASDGTRPQPNDDTRHGLVVEGFVTWHVEMSTARDNGDQTRSGYPSRMTQGAGGEWRISEM